MAGAGRIEMSEDRKCGDCDQHRRVVHSGDIRDWKRRLGWCMGKYSKVKTSEWWSPACGDYRFGGYLHPYGERPGRRPSQ